MSFVILYLAEDIKPVIKINCYTLKQVPNFPAKPRNVL